MEQNLEHYITRKITSIYSHKILSPIIYLIILILLWFILPLNAAIFPIKYDETTSLAQFYEDNDPYVQTTLTNLHFTGYTQTIFGFTTGYYYYKMQEDTCLMVLLSPHTCQEGLPLIEEITVYSKIEHNNATLISLEEHLADDLDWTFSGISGKVSPFYLTEPGYHIFLHAFITFLFLATGVYSIGVIILYILYCIFPVLSPSGRTLALYGNSKKLLEQAEEELATLPQLATEDMFITEHFFIAISADGVAIIPIQEIIWIYKHSTLHKFFWYHFSISYTLHITANKHLYIQLPKNLKSDIDGIMDYLAEANHNILVGFSEENRRAVIELQGKPLQFEKLLSFLKKRI